jgi:Flp pilus assembly protein TadG
MPEGDKTQFTAPDLIDQSRQTAGRMKTPGMEAGHSIMDKFGASIPVLSHRLRSIAESELAAEVFEFAIVGPLVLMLLIGIFWIGRAYNVYETVTRAAREGARYAVLPSAVDAGNAPPDALSSSCTSNTNTFNNYVAPALQSDGLDPKAVTNYCQKAQLLENTYPQQCGVVISFTYPVQMAIPFTSLNATTINIPAQSQMRLENQNKTAGGVTLCP